MRTPVLAVALVASVLALVPTASADTDALGELLEKLGLGPAPSAPEQPELPPVPDVDPADPTAGANGFLAAITGAVNDVIVQPVILVTTILTSLGLRVALPFQEGASQGVNVVAAAMNAVATNPGKSLFISGMSVALVGASAAIGHWVQKHGSFGGIPLYPLYTRIQKSELLENGVRQQIFDMIQANPGINVSELSRRLDIAWGTATHHLQKLRHEKLVSIRMTSNQKCYFPNGGTYTPREMDVMSAVKHPTAKNIAEFLIQNGPRCHRDIVEALGLTPALVSFHTSKLVDNGLVGREKQGRNTVFTALEANLQPVPRPATH